MVKIAKKVGPVVEPPQSSAEESDDGSSSDFEEPFPAAVDDDEGGGGFQSKGLVLTRPENLNLDGYASEGELDTRRLIAEQNRKKKKSGGFQSMGLGHSVFKGIIRRGYKVPTPIQRKAIPVIMEGRDVVAMARTGSGKTAAFLIPMLEKLQTRQVSGGARALILSPTRELALQTLKFTKEIGRYTGLKAAVVLGGDDMDSQFAALHENPDVILATPGRLMHVCVEMGLKLSSVRYVVFDEADRLFEMGFQEQLHDILRRLTCEDRQTLLFSATLPKLLVDFAKAGLSDPYLIRLDVESKLSDMLQTEFFEVRNEDKIALLLYTLKNLIDPSELTVVFVATKHHVEFLSELLTASGITNTFLYSSLDATARKINAAKFSSRKIPLLIVTDVAARGIDIPLLDNVINFHFPAKGKLFVHRVGRVARAGRSGKAYSFVCCDEIPYLLDLHLFLGKPVENFGSATQTVLESEKDIIRRSVMESRELQKLETAATNGMSKYLKSRTKPSAESLRRAKLLRRTSMAGEGTFVSKPHASLSTVDHDEGEKLRMDLLLQVKAYRPKATVFEIAASKKPSPWASTLTTITKPVEMMKEKRNRDARSIAKYQDKYSALRDDVNVVDATRNGAVESVDDDTLERTFSDVFIAKKSTEFVDPFPKRKKKNALVDEDHFVPFVAADADTERGLSVNAGSVFEKEALGAMLDITADDDGGLRAQQTGKKWDRKRKRFVGDKGREGKDKRIKTEDGRWIKASYKSGRYEDWKKKNRMHEEAARRQQGDEADEDDDDDPKKVSKGKKQQQQQKSMKKKGPEPSRGLQVLGTRGKFHSRGAKFPTATKGGRGELQSVDQIVKKRKIKRKREIKMQRKQAKGRRLGGGVGGGRGGGGRGGGGGRPMRGGKRR